MIKKLILFILLSLCVALQASAWNPMIMTSGVGCSFSTEDFTTYTEVEPVGTTLVQVSATKVTWEDVDRDTDAYQYRDEGAAATIFDGDFTHRFETEATYTTDVFGVAGAWGLSTDLDDMNNITDGIFFEHRYDATNNKWEFKLRLWVDGASSQVATVTAAITQATPYFVTITRDDDAGDNSTGLITAVIRLTSHTAAVHDTISVSAPAGEQHDYRYIYVTQSLNDGNAARNHDGYTATLEIKPCL